MQKFFRFLLLFNFIFKINCEDDIPKEFIKDFLPDNPIIIEAGAFDGKDSLAMSIFWPHGKIYAFEPIPSLYQAAVNETKNRNNVKIYPIALGDKIGFADFYVSSGMSTASSSLLKPSGHLQYFPAVQFNTVIKVPVITLDKWAEDQNIDHVDFMWLDMQGAEYLMLKASPKILRTVKAIYTEISGSEMYQGAPLYPALKNWLATQGFKYVAGYIPPAGFSNAFFVREKSYE